MDEAIPQTRAFETHAYVLAVIPPKMFLRDSRPRGETTVQAIGESHFTLLELTPSRTARLNPQDRVTLDKGPNGKIDHVKRRIFFEDLAPESTAELPLVIEMIVTKHEHKYVQFFNEAQPLTTRMHSLQLLPGIGQTLMWAILEERKREPFKSFDDIAARTKLQNPKKVVASRIFDELREEVKRWLFVRPPKRDEEERERPPRDRHGR
jgi:putative nucleotide binding protein